MTTEAFNARRRRIQRAGMIVLAAWAGVNIVGGTAMFFLDEAHRFFYQMNAIWNLVNAGLAAGGLLGTRKPTVDWSLTRSIEAQHNLEKILLVNGGLDFGYIMGGLFLMQLADELTRWAAQLPGWGAAIVLQGAFLLIFDFALFLVLRRNRGYRELLGAGTGPPGPAAES